MYKAYSQGSAKFQKATQSLAGSQPNDMESLKIKLIEYKKQANMYKVQNVQLNTQNQQLQKEIQNNEKVIEQILNKKNIQTNPMKSGNPVNHFSMMMQCKRQLRNLKHENAELNNQLTKLTREIKNTKKNDLWNENRDLKFQKK